jgi:hypothetical protein
LALIAWASSCVFPSLSLQLHTCDTVSALAPAERTSRTDVMIATEIFFIYNPYLVVGITSL